MRLRCPCFPKVDLEEPLIRNGRRNCSHITCWLSVGSGLSLDWSFRLFLRVMPAFVTFLEAHLHYHPAKGGLPPLLAVLCFGSFDHSETNVKAARHWDWWTGFHEPCISKGSRGKPPDCPAFLPPTVGRGQMALGHRGGMSPPVTGVNGQSPLPSCPCVPASCHFKVEWEGFREPVSRACADSDPWLFLTQTLRSSFLPDIW